MIAKWKKQRTLNRVRARLEMLGQIFDTLDLSLINNKVPDDERVKFWLKFIGDRAYRVKFIEDTIAKYK